MDYQSISSNNNVCFSSSVPGSGLSPGVVAGICVSVLLLVSVVVGAAVAVIYYRHHGTHAGEPQNVSITSDDLTVNIKRKI